MPPRRDALLGALETLLAERRFEQIEIADITRQAGVTRSGFYFYFPNKAAAVAALLEDVAEQMVAVAADWYEREDAPHDVRVRRGMEATIAFWREHARLMTAMFEATATSAQARELWDAWFDALVERAAARIEADRAAGIAANGVGAHALASMLTGMTLNAMERDVRGIVERGEEVPDLADALVHIWDLALYGAHP